MADEELDVPCGDGKYSVRVVALHKGKTTGAFSYLQGIRQGTLIRIKADPEDTETARVYHQNEKEFANTLAGAIDSPIDAVISPQSDHPNQAELYREAIVARHAVPTDLTDRFCRTGDARAGKGASLDEIISNLSYHPSGDEKDLSRIVIVDDTFTTGTTTAAIISVLRDHGLPDDCEVIVACPLWLDTVKREES